MPNDVIVYGVSCAVWLSGRVNRKELWGITGASITPTKKGEIVRSDRDKAVMWAQEHWTVAQCVCVCIAGLGLMCVELNFMTSPAALVASLLGIAYVLLLTKHCTHDVHGKHRPSSEK